MNTIQIGKFFEKKAAKLLSEIGFSKVKIMGHNKPYDIEAWKEGKKYFIEVRGRSKGSNINFFMFTKRKLKGLRKFKNVLLFLINHEGYKIIPLEKIKDSAKPIELNEKRIYVVFVSKKYYKNRYKGKKCIFLILEDDEHEKLSKMKGSKTWEEFLIGPHLLITLSGDSTATNVVTLTDSTLITSGTEKSKRKKKR